MGGATRRPTATRPCGSISRRGRQRRVAGRPGLVGGVDARGRGRRRRGWRSGRASAGRRDRPRARWARRGGRPSRTGAPIDELVLWGAPTQGRVFLREQRAFAELQSTRSRDGTSATDALPEGWLEVGGFVLSAETIAAIGRSTLATMPRSPPAGAPARPRRDAPTTARLEEQLCRPASRWRRRRATAGPAWSSTRSGTPRRSRVFGRVAAWLARRATGRCADDPRRASGRSDDSRWSRTASGSGRSRSGSSSRSAQLFGMLGEPVDRPRSDVCAIFLNAGAVRRIGPNRLWVEAARRWSARGHPHAQDGPRGDR